MSEIFSFEIIKNLSLKKSFTQQERLLIKKYVQIKKLNLGKILETDSNRRGEEIAFAKSLL